jgi:hypothetical protein
MDMNIAAAGNTDVVRAKVRTLEMLGLQENIEDILITLDSQYHLIRLLQGQRGGDGLFLHLSLNKDRADLGLARHRLRKIEAELEVFRDVTIRNDGGYLAIYAVGELSLLAVIGDAGPNIARLHLETRAVTARQATLLDIRAFQDPFQGR